MAKMRFMEELLREHELIEQVVGSLLTYAGRLKAGEAPVEDGAGLVRFFRVFAGGLHHAREEEVLFPALVNEVALPGDRGPIAALLADHHEMAELLSGMESILASDLTPESAARFSDLAYQYENQLLQHIDAENSVMIPEAEARLVRSGVRELETREPTSEEKEVELSGRQLVERYPPTEDPDLVRGEGCVMCTSYGVRCEGLEREWWNEYEWLESDEHIASS
jgi:hemerythrin-like domain-containing protein